MDTFEPQPRSLREMLWLLREFEGSRCLWRVPAAAIAFASAWLISAAGAVAAIYIGSDLRFYRVVLGAVVSLGSVALAGNLARRQLWRSVFDRRLFSYEDPSPRTTLELLIRDEDYERATHALRRGRFVPTYAARVGTPPPDAVDLTARIGVQEPVAWMRSTSDEDRIARIAETLQAAGIRARVSGRDVSPDGPADLRRTDDGRRLDPSSHQT